MLCVYFDRISAARSEFRHLCVYAEASFDLNTREVQRAKLVNLGEGYIPG